jgi:hypothetical protein
MKRSSTPKKTTPAVTTSLTDDVVLVAVPDGIEPSAPDASSGAKPAPETRGRIAASVETLTLLKGLYLISVRSSTPPTQVDGLLLPAMQLGAGPVATGSGGAPDNVLEIMSSPGMEGAWLCRPGDKLVAKVATAAASILMTSIRTPEMTPLLIEVENLDVRAKQGGGADSTQLGVTVSTSGQAILPGLPAAMPSASTTDMPLQIVAHIQNRGDVPFIDAPWAGFAGQRLAIEGFSITSLKKIAASEIEYKALSATRNETPWVSGGALCGTRGKGLPLVGFCIRVKPQPDGKRYDCEYSGTFASGKVIGPVKNGAPCWSTASGDFLEALQVKIVERPAAKTNS